MKRPCIDCGVVIASGSRCGSCYSTREKRYSRVRGTTTERGYGSAWQKLSTEILKRDGYTCHYCGGRADTADHIIPKSKGGTDARENLVAACRSHNSGKGNRPAELFRQQVRGGS